MKKTEFVRTHPNLSTTALILLAKKQHKMTITPAHVYTIRAYLKRQGNAKASKATPATAPVPRTNKGLGAAIDTLARRFVDDLFRHVRTASLADVLGEG